MDYLSISLLPFSELKFLFCIDDSIFFFLVIFDFFMGLFLNKFNCVKYAVHKRTIFCSAFNDIFRYGKV